MEILILLGLIILNGLFVMSEIALVSARKARLETMAEKGDKKAESALKLSNSPETFLSAAQIGITLIAILTGVYSGERFGSRLAPYVAQIDFLEPYAETVATTIVVIIVTFLSIVFGELIPKRIGLLNAEKIAKAVVGPMRGFAKLTYPIVWLLNKTSNLFLAYSTSGKQRMKPLLKMRSRLLLMKERNQAALKKKRKNLLNVFFI
jgi:putative hemolysin